VLYQALYGDTTAWWVRPQPMFLETVRINQESVPRFAWVADV
jgi:hypothetical protein